MIEGMIEDVVAYGLAALICGLAVLGWWTVAYLLLRRGIPNLTIYLDGDPDEVAESPLARELPGASLAAHDLLGPE